METLPNPPDLDGADEYGLYCAALDRLDEMDRLRLEAGDCFRWRRLKEARARFEELVRIPTPDISRGYADDPDGPAKLARWHEETRRVRAQYRAYLGHVCLHQFDLAAAESAYQAAIAEDPDGGGAWLGWSVCALFRGRWRLARERWAGFLRAIRATVEREEQAKASGAAK